MCQRSQIRSLFGSRPLQGPYLNLTSSLQRIPAKNTQRSSPFRTANETIAGFREEGAPLLLSSSFCYLCIPALKLAFLQQQHVLHFVRDVFRFIDCVRVSYDFEMSEESIILSQAFTMFLFQCTSSIEKN